MNTTYRLHPGEYAVGENESFYSEMAAKGWLLNKRGAYFSRFRKSRPEKRLYRVELANPDFLDDAHLPDEQIALYEGCGWQYVSGCGLVHVFTVPEGSGAPEIHTDPPTQASTLRALKRSYISAFATVLVILCLHLLLACTMPGTPLNIANSWGADIVVAFFRADSLCLAYFFFVIQSLLVLVYGAARTWALYRRLKGGKPIDHSHVPRRRIYRSVCASLISLCLIFLMIAAVEIASLEKYDMPESSDGPYITLADMGIDEKRTENSIDGSGSSVEISRSLSCTFYHTREFTDDKWMYQDVYVLRFPALTGSLAECLMYDCTFADGPQDFTAVDIDGLDSAWQSDMEYICVRGDTVWYITCSSFIDSGLFPLEAVASNTQA